MGFAVCHIQKGAGNDAPVTAHIGRRVHPANADQSREYLNEQLVDYPEGVEDRTAAIQHRIDTAGITRKISHNQVRALRVMLSGTHEDMVRIEAAGQLNEWCADSLKWLQETFGADNVVSADLHRDEQTPHIHATIVPIATGEKRIKPTNKPTDPNKKKYRKKPANTVRLCADDVMTRKNLERFQDTYAERMEKYGLERGIRGSEARHITTQQYYRDAFAKTEDLKADIAHLEVEKHEVAEQIQVLHERKDEAQRDCSDLDEYHRRRKQELEERERQALARTEQATTQKQQAETALAGKQSELQRVKGELKTEKFKGSVAEAGTAVMDGLSSALGTSKVKRQQQEIEALRSGSDAQKLEIARLNQTIDRERQEHTKTTDDLRAELNKIYDLLPDTRQLVRMGDYCRDIGFTAEMTKRLVNMQTVHFSGSLYSHEYSRRFDTDNSEARLERDPKRPGFFNLLIDRIHIVDWFQQKYDQFLKAIGINVKPKDETNLNRSKGLRVG